MPHYIHYTLIQLTILHLRTKTPISKTSRAILNELLGLNKKLYFEHISKLQRLTVLLCVRIVGVIINAILGLSSNRYHSYDWIVLVMAIFHKLVSRKKVYAIEIEECLE